MVQPTRLGTSSRGGGLLRALPLWSLIVAEVAALVVYGVMRATGQAQTPSTATAVGVGVLGALMALSTRTGISGWGRISRRVAYLRRRMRDDEDPPIPFDVPLPDGQSIGLRWAQDRLIAVVRIARPVDPSVLVADADVVAGSSLTVGVVARALSQFDIELESIDVVAHGWRTRGAAHLTAAYTTLTRTLPTVPQQDVWVVLRLNPLHCPDAVESRGGGPTGVIRTAIAATRRVANQLAREGYRTSILTAHQISAMGSQLLDGVSVDSAEEHWTEVGFGNYRVTAYTTTAPIDDAMSTRIWSTPSVSTTTATTVSRVRDNAYAMSTVVRYATVGDLTTTVPEGLARLDGRQRPAVDLTLPVGRSDVRGVAVGVYRLTELDSIRLADGGSGQLIGANARGEAVAVPLFGADVRRADVYGPLYFVHQIVARAIAVGARVLVRTDRTDAWRPIVDAVNDPMTLFVSASPTDQRHAHSTYTLCILDAREATEDPTITTQLRVHRSAREGTGLDDGSDISVRQDTATQGRVNVVTRSGTTAVTLVSIPAENTLIEGANRVRSMQAATPPRRPAMAASGVQAPTGPDTDRSGDPSRPGRHSHSD